AIHAVLGQAREQRRIIEAKPTEKRGGGSQRDQLVQRQLIDDLAGFLGQTKAKQAYRKVVAQQSLSQNQVVQIDVADLSQRRVLGTSNLCHLAMNVRKIKRS